MTNKKPSQAELAAALGLTPGRITGLKKQGMPIYSVEAARAWRAQNIAPVPTAKSTPTALPGKADAPTVRPPGYDESRARREAAEAAMAEMREAEMRGELIRVDAVRSALAGVLSATRDAFLGLPDRMATVLAVESDPAAVHQALSGETHRILSTLVAGAARLGKADQEEAAP